MIPESGLALREEFRTFDAMERFRPEVPFHPEPEACSCGDVLRGVKTPLECPLFGTACSPESPVGACMVSTEGSCAAYYKYGAYRG
jgi:hydrogenase expression/formation protein HypD